MYLFLLIFTSSILMPSTNEKIPYDWVGQYGLFKNDGVVLLILIGDQGIFYLMELGQIFQLCSASLLKQVLIKT